MYDVIFESRNISKESKNLEFKARDPDEEKGISDTEKEAMDQMEKQGLSITLMVKYIPKTHSRTDERFFCWKRVMIDAGIITAFLKNFLQKMVFLTVKHIKFREKFQRKVVFSLIRCVFQKPKGAAWILQPSLGHAKKEWSHHFEEKSLNIYPRNYDKIKKRPL